MVMSKHNNVNPGQYKVGGREKPDTLARERLKGGRSQAPKTTGAGKGTPKGKGARKG